MGIKKPQFNVSLDSQRLTQMKVLNLKLSDYGDIY